MPTIASGSAAAELAETTMARRPEAERLLAESHESDAADHLARLEKARRLYGEIGDLNGVALT